MKPQIRSKTPYVFPSHSNRLRHSARVLETIRRMTSELGDLQEEICSSSGGPAEVLRSFSARDHGAAQLALNDFRLALDQLRYLLWTSLAASEPAAETPSQVMAERTPLPSLQLRETTAPTSGSFFDRLDVVIEAYMKNNAPAEAGASKRPKS